MPMIRIRSSSIQNSVHLGGTPTASDLTQIATTAYVSNAISELVNSAPEVLDTLAEIATSISNDTNQS